MHRREECNQKKLVSFSVVFRWPKCVFNLSMEGSRNIELSHFPSTIHLKSLLLFVSIHFVIKKTYTHINQKYGPTETKGTKIINVYNLINIMKFYAIDIKNVRPFSIVNVKYIYRKLTSTWKFRIDINSMDDVSSLIW